MFSVIASEAWQSPLAAESSAGDCHASLAMTIIFIFFYLRRDWHDVDFSSGQGENCRKSAAYTE